MTFKELKQPFLNIVGSIDINKYNANDVVMLYNQSDNSHDKNLYISILILKSWKILQSIYYKNNNANLSEEDCYEIFLETLDYVCTQSVWLNKDSTLYNDKDAFLKAMNTTIQCRKKNFINAKFRQKRFANYDTISLDVITDEYSDGYFTPYLPEYNFEEDEISNQIIRYFKSKDYITAFLLDSVINFNIFDDDNGMLDVRKLRKHLRHLDDNFCAYFSIKYGLKENEVLYSRKYFSNIPQSKLDKKLYNAFTNLKNNVIIKQIVYDER